MSALGQHLGMTIRLYYRNPIALLYGYLFPIIFLFAFYVYYRTEQVPLWAHMGQLLAVTALSGVCFGLPTTLVSERERGVWRRYRLTPIPTSTLVASTIIARYLLTITTGLLQIALAMAIGMPMPLHPFELLVAFTFVCWGFVGMGLVISTLADTVPAVQALGQCLFLPLLMIGGVATPLSGLPDWAQHISAFFPGRYAVQAMDASIRGSGLSGAPFSLIALVVIGAAAVFAGTKLFRWDAMQRFNLREGRGWIALALSSWIVIGVLAESSGRILVVSDANERYAEPTYGPPKAPLPEQTPTPAPTQPAPPQLSAAAPTPAAPAPVAPAPVVASTTEPTTSDENVPAWKKLESRTWWGLPYDDLPPNAGVEAPLAWNGPEDELTKDVDDEIKMVATNIKLWEPAKETDPIQRIRNLIYIAVVTDAAKWTSERHMPWMVYEQLTADYPKEDLIKMLTWIVLHPKDGTVVAAERMNELNLLLNPPGEEELRRRTMWYAEKFIAVLLNKPLP